MIDECKGVHNWFNCLNCGLLSTHLCPLEGDDALDKIANRIRTRSTSQPSRAAPRPAVSMPQLVGFWEGPATVRHDGRRSEQEQYY